MIDAVVDLMEVQLNDRILHLGFGDGAVTRKLARLAVNGVVLGVDVSDNLVWQARKLLADIENVMFVPGSPEEIPWQEDFFSAVLSTTPPWPDPPRAAREIHRVTAPGGRLLAFDLTAGAAPSLAAAGFEAVEVRQTAAGLLLAARKPKMG